MLSAFAQNRVTVASKASTLDCKENLKAAQRHYRSTPSDAKLLVYISLSDAIMTLKELTNDHQDIHCGVLPFKEQTINAFMACTTVANEL